MVFLKEQQYNIFICFFKSEKMKSDLKNKKTKQDNSGNGFFL